MSIRHTNYFAVGVENMF